LTFRDGEIMKGISILGMIFLPGTFVSVGGSCPSLLPEICLLTTQLEAVFSMSFFDFATEGDGGSDRWALSRKFWLYWVVALPLTVVTLALWYIWQRGHARREERTQV
jgi:hypothetical protein